eukprot:9487591-Pyramimonas_sp.AAC.1
MPAGGSGSKRPSALTQPTPTSAYSFSQHTSAVPKIASAPGASTDAPSLSTISVLHSGTMRSRGRGRTTAVCCSAHVRVLNCIVAHNCCLHAAP